MPESTTKVILRLDSADALRGPVRWLRAGQRITVGRSGWADVSLPADEALADVHFSVSLFGGRCHLKDLGSATGTFVNGACVLEATLQHGDRIIAGHSRFVIEIDGAGDDLSRSGTVPASGKPPATVAHPAGGDPLLQTDRLDSGLIRFRPSTASTIPLPLIVDRLFCQLPIFALARFSDWTVPLPEELAGTTDTVPAVDHPRQVKFASVLFHAALPSDPLALVQRIADAGDLLVVLSEADKDDLLARMRGNPALFLSLDALRGTLVKSKPPDVEKLLGPIAALLLWRDGEWELFSRGEPFPHAHALGFRDVSELGVPV